MDPQGKSTTFIQCADGTLKPLKTFLEEDIDESLHEMIRTNVLTATRNFHHRVIAFRNEIIMGKNSPLHVKYISYRIEFQARGAAHIHGVLWLDLEKIENELDKDQTNKKMNLVSAFKKLRFEEQLTEEEKNSLVLFTDRFISCSLNPNLMTQEVIDIVKEVNIHRCTTKCQYQCKYSFPKYPLKETIFIDKNEPLPAEDKDENSEVILTNVNNILKDDDKLAEIQQKYPNKGTTKEANDVLRSKRIETMLKMAGNIKYQDYVMAIKRSKRYGSTVLLQRDLDEVYVNNYNKEWITNWNANLDIQLVPDMFGVVTYVTDYWLKPDKGMTDKT